MLFEGCSEPASNRKRWRPATTLLLLTTTNSPPLNDTKTKKEQAQLKARGIPKGWLPLLQWLVLCVFYACCLYFVSNEVMAFVWPFVFCWLGTVWHSIESFCWVGYFTISCCYRLSYLCNADHLTHPTLPHFTLTPNLLFTDLHLRQFHVIHPRTCIANARSDLDVNIISNENSNTVGE